MSAVGRVAAILAAFQADDRDTLGVSELARRTGLPKPTVHRLVGQLIDNGLLERSGRTVRLGLKLFELGQLVPRQRNLREAARPAMADLREATRHTVNLAILQGTELLYIEILHGPDAPAVPTRVGGRWPLHATGVGKALLAFSPEEKINSLLRGELPRLSERTITTPGRFAQELARIRRTGIAFDSQESQPGLVCAASPVFAPGGELVAGLSVSGWSTKTKLDRVAAAVHTAALTISRELDSVSA